MFEWERAMFENGATETEILFDRVRTLTLMKLINRAKAVYDVEISENAYGEFLFLTLQLEYQGEDYYITFYGLGYHWVRDRYLVNEWGFYPEFNYKPKNKVPKKKAIELIRKRYKEISKFAKNHKQSKEGALRELIAELTDDDFAMTTNLI